MPRRLVARSHREAYDLLAIHYEDPALMANRDAETTRLKIARLAEQLPLTPEARVLDVGPGDGALFHLIGPRVASCLGVDPSANAVARLTEMFRDVPGVEFAVGASDRIDAPDATFDLVVVNSVLHVLPSVKDVERSLAELVRVCRPGGLLFVGELPFRSELGRGVLAHITRKLWEYGPRAYLRLMYHVYARPVLCGEPALLFPINNLHVPEDEFRAMCVPLDMTAECRRHRELRRPSLTRNDYLLKRR